MTIIRYSRVFRWIVRGFLLVFTLSLSAVSLLGGFSAVKIFDPSVQNVNIPDGEITANFDITNPSGMFINVPFNISNSGVYDLTKIKLRFQVAMTYGNASTPLNDTTTVKIFDKEESFGTIAQGVTLKDNLTGSVFTNLPDPSTEVDWTRTPYALEFYAYLTFSASYSLNLYTFTVNIINFTAGHFP